MKEILQSELKFDNDSTVDIQQVDPLAQSRLLCEGFIWCENTWCPFSEKCKRFDWGDKFLTEKWDSFDWTWQGCNMFLNDEFKTVHDAFA